LGKGRCEILIHAANRASELKGCIAPGQDWTMDDGEPIVTSSRRAIADLHAVLDGQERMGLEIRLPPAKRALGLAAGGKASRPARKKKRPGKRVRVKKAGRKGK
ncbi:MAG TPA: DUF5675 family protein, partial [Steroidobacteraceae bacterium]|nr:DUF5675 family protein [Steroidobacteraceae bacterium]